MDFYNNNSNNIVLFHSNTFPYVILKDIMLITSLRLYIIYLNVHISVYKKGNDNHAVSIIMHKPI